MATIPELEKKWRAAAEDQAAAKREFDATVRQMDASGRRVYEDPAVAIAASNLGKSIERYRSTFQDLMQAIENVQKDTTTASDN